MYLAPSILSANFIDLKNQIESVIAGGADLLHIDVMDGHFVPNLTFGPFIIKQIKKNFNIPLDVHLMISNPENYIEEYISAGADYLTFHFETVKHIHRYIEKIKQLGAKAGLAINPHTSVYELEEILLYLDMILVMSVNPGFGGQKFIPSSIQKIKKLTKLIEELKLPAKPLIEIDGGINLDNIEILAKEGVDIFVAGSSIFNTPDILTATKEFKNKLTGLNLLIGKG